MQWTASFSPPGRHVVVLWLTAILQNFSLISNEFWIKTYHLNIIVTVWYDKPRTMNHSTFLIINTNTLFLDTLHSNKQNFNLYLIFTRFLRTSTDWGEGLIVKMAAKGSTESWCLYVTSQRRENHKSAQPNSKPPSRIIFSIPNVALCHSFPTQILCTISIYHTATTSSA